VRRMVAATVLLLLLVVPGVSDATSANHCAFRLDPFGRVGARVQARPVLIGCYSTFAAAVEAGSGGVVRLAEGTTPESITDSAVGEQLAADVLIGTEYGALSYGGASKSYFASSTCSATQTWDVNYVGDTWNDTFSSGKGFGGCDHNRKFEHADFGGTVVLCTPNCTSYGSSSNTISSLRWKP
jgi:hypothetical protein